MNTLIIHGMEKMININFFYMDLSDNSIETTIICHIHREDGASFPKLKINSLLI